jgi:hypothetical protein
MVIRRWEAIVVGVAVVLLVVAERACTVYETPVEEYSTLAEARAAGTIARGWIPDFLPPNATHLREVHEIDSIERWLAFTAPIPELRTMASRLAPLSYEDARRTAVHRSWVVGGDWPPELSKRFWHTPRSTSLLSYHISRAEQYCVAIEWRTGRAWGWSCPRAS